MERYDVVVAGAGLLGLFAARSLTRYRLRVLVLEQREDVCLGMSKANSAVIYSGYELAPGSLKAKLCVPAARNFAELCAELGVRYSPCGSLMTAYGPAGERSLMEKYRRGLENGVQGLRLLGGSEAARMEPNLAPGLFAALLSPSSGTVNPWELGIAAFENARSNGAEFRFRARVRAIVRSGGRFVVETEAGDFSAGCVINCAGTGADRVRELIREPLVRLRMSTADFAVFDPDTAGYVRHIILHEREDAGKGLTVVPTVDGGLLMESPFREDITGEDFGWTAPRCTREGQEEILRLSGEILPGLDTGKIIRYFASVRPQVMYVERRPDGEFADTGRRVRNFTVLREDGLISLIGIRTPGLTCAQPLGEYAAEAAVAHLGGAERNPSYDPVRRPGVRTAEKNGAELAELIRRDPLYGRIVCRCGRVTEGEIRDAVRAGAVTLEGLRHRAGIGLGRCQGDFCAGRAAELLASYLGKGTEQVLEAFHG